MPIIIFFLIALGWSDIIWIFLNPAVQKEFSFNISLNWAWLGLIGPGVAAILVSLYLEKVVGLKKLFKPLLCWRVPWPYYVFVYLGVFLFYCAASWVTLLFQGLSDHKSIYWLLENVKGPLLNAHGIWILIELTVIYTVCEELGWRGFALPALANHMNVLFATLLIGMVWTLWHVPLIYLYGAKFTAYSLFIYSLHITSFSIFYSWLYHKADGSLLLVGLLHGATDAFGGFFPALAAKIGQGPNVYTVILEVMLAIIMSPYLYNLKITAIKKYMLFKE